KKPTTNPGAGCAVIKHGRWTSRLSKGKEDQMKTFAMKLQIMSLAAVSLLALDAGRTSGANSPGVLRVSSKPYYGKTYGQWVVAYWQWAMSIPMASNPWANDPTGQFAALGQIGPVWFLGGSLGDSVTRTLTIPAGKAIFLPVHQWVFGATVGDCDPSNP